MYDAFISYRHTELDQFVAENLHKKLEAFRLPKSIVQIRGKDCKKRIDRVFRDRDELPLASNLEDPIVNALEESNFLIVICSPRLSQSQWCKKEIETFISMHGREKVLAVLVEGEPQDSFPEELLYREKTITKEDGSIVSVREAVEPLAADVRGKTKKEILKAMDGEILRLAAVMFGCGYDDLKQRHREQKMRKLLTASFIASSIFLAFGAVSSAMLVRIRMQKSQIEQQKEQIELQYQEALRNQSRSIAEKALGILKEGNRFQAISTLLPAFETTKEGIPMPITAEAEYALAECSYIYQNGKQMLPYKTYEHETNVLQMQVSEDKKHLLSVDRSGGVYVWEVESGKLLYHVQTEAFSNQFESECCFLTNDKIAYKNKSRLEIYDLQKDKIVFQHDENYSIIIASLDGQKFAIFESGFQLDSVSIYDMNTFEIQQTYELEKQYKHGKTAIFDASGENLIFSGVPVNGAEKKGATLFVFNLENSAIVKEYSLKYSDVNVLKVDDNYLYACVNQTMDDKFPDNNYDIMATLSSQVLKINLDSQKIEWKFESDNNIKNCIFSGDNRSEHLLVSYYSNACILDKKTGELLKNYVFEREIINVLNVEQSNLFILMTRNGDFHVINESDLVDYSYGNYLMLENANLKDFVNLDLGYSVLSYDSKNIVQYAKYLGIAGEEFANSDLGIADIEANESESVVLVETFQEKDVTKGLLVDTNTRKIISELNLDGYQTFMGFVGDGSKFVYAVDSNRKITIYNINDGSLEKTYLLPDNFYYQDVKKSADGNCLIFDMYDNLCIFNLLNGNIEEIAIEEIISNFNGSSERVISNSMQFYANLNSDENKVEIYENDGKLLCEISIPLSYTDVLLFMEEDKEIFVQYLDGSSQIYSIQTGKPVTEFDLFQTKITKILSAGENIIFIGETEGYLVNSNREVIARIPNCKAVLPQRNEILSVNRNTVYVFPMYSSEEMVQAAQKILDSNQQ